MISRNIATGGGEVIMAFLTLVLRRFWMIFLIVGVGALASFAYGRMQVPGYEASAFVQVRSGVDVEAAKAQLTSRRNLLAMALRHRLNTLWPGISVDRAAVLLRQAVAVRDMTSKAGRTLGFAPETTGIVVSVLLGDAETSARIANDLAQQILDTGNAGELDESADDLEFFRLEEQRLWQESSALQAEVAAMVGNGRVDGGDTVLLDQRRLRLLKDQYDLVRQRLAGAELAARRNVTDQAGRFSLLQRATATEAVSVVRNWMLVGVAGSLLLAVALACVLERRYPGLKRGPWGDLAGLRRVVWHIYRQFDDPARPILGLPRYLVMSAVLVVILVSVAALIR